MSDQWLNEQRQRCAETSRDESPGVAGAGRPPRSEPERSDGERSGGRPAPATPPADPGPAIAPGEHDDAAAVEPTTEPAAAEKASQDDDEAAFRARLARQLCLSGGGNRGHRGRRLVKPQAPETTPQATPLTAEQRLLLLDTWLRSGLPAGDFAALVGMSKHTLYAWKKKFDSDGPAGLMDRIHDASGRTGAVRKSWPVLAASARRGSARS